VLFAATQTTWIAASAVATLFLAVATAAFVYAAFKQIPILRESQHAAARSAEAAARAADAAETAVEVNRSAAFDQSIAAVFPMLFLTLRTSSYGPKVEIANRGQVPAVDVDLRILMVFFEEDVPLAEFAEKYFRDSDRLGLEEAGPVGEDGWALADHLIYTYIPSQIKVTAECPSPLPPKNIYVLVQSRDVLGRNYARLDWYHLVEGEDRYRFSGEARHPAVHSPRLGLDFKPDPEEGAAEEGKMPPFLEEEIARDIEPMSSHVFSVAYLREGAADWEDRGEWEDLQQ
jgi:hypothetical protein